VASPTWTHQPLATTSSNATAGYLGQLTAELATVRATWSSAGNASTATEAFVGSFTVGTYEASFGLLQLGFFSVLPYFLELWLEYDLAHAAWENLNLIAMGSWVFFLFASQTKGYRLAEAIRHGKAGYVATGRGYVIEPGSFIGLYAVYAKSHMYTGFEVLCLLIVYHVFAEEATWAAVWTLWFFACSMLLAPYVFNPQSLSTNTIAQSFEELRQWYAGEADKTSKDHHGSWKLWHKNRLATVRGSSTFLKVQDHTRLLLIRIVLLLPAASKLQLEPASLPSYRFLLLLLAGGLFIGGQVIIYLLASERTLCVRGLDHTSRALGIVYRLLVVVSVAASGCLLLHYLTCDYVVFTWSVEGRTNAYIFFYVALLISTYVTQLLVTLEPPPDPAKEDRQGSACGRACAAIKGSLIAYADAWYFLMDVIITLTLISTLSILSWLPLLRLQSMALFNRDFARVIATKLTRAELLKRILA